MIPSKIGNLFFKIRSFTPIPFICALLYFAKPAGYTIVIGIPFIVAGEFLRIWAVGYAGASTRARTLGAARDLVTTGPYSYVRNPLYLGNFLLSLGVCLVANIYWLVAVLIIGYFCQYLPIIAVEEAYLSDSCGSVYQTYREQVPRFMPQFRSYPDPSPHDFCFTRAIKSEKRTLTAIVCVIGLIFARHAINVL
ncbi:isoprenylcysteine carboxylmethyltransferase family protein [Candidatus Poribacteria bacterium]|nr:isoprenylcysteine carboxylmethyltransferase family protein [Candidatus Poribacteria bacterium]MYG07592.1 isoprenylcysteine carboxylmethyltransferase family protein [Candidatus Poribacteria bacterium]MYK24076.1 isoprenylcysteine carboxylmethyltransferase family protein [Candidatus Poribacteria bacterium]